jgi:hypothetical protein
MFNMIETTARVAADECVAGHARGQIISALHYGLPAILV